LAGSINNLVGQELASPGYQANGAINPEVAADLSAALTTIEKRSQGLLHFVEAYRNLTKIPAPKFRFVGAAELIGQVQCLLESRLKAANITFTAEVDPLELELAVDPDLIEQVLINLVLNSIQALDGCDTGAIVVRARIDRGGKTLVEVIDNGAGIAESAVEKVFIPFFTTKKGGTGIGLALARQIMRLHAGNITVRSAPNERTCFTLSF
jgi:signal transduction histidine kinase